MADFGAYFSGKGGGVEKLKDGIKTLGEFLQRIVDDIKTFGLKETFMKYVIEPLKRMFTGESADDKKKRLTEDYDKRIASVDKNSEGGADKIAKLQAERISAFKEFHDDTVNKKFNDPKITVNIEEGEFEKFLKLSEKL